MTRVPLILVRTPMARRCGLLALALLPLWLLLLRTATPGGDAALGWLRRSRDARVYVRPGVPTTLLDAAAPCSAGVRLLLLVVSRPDGEDQRRAVRDTWGRALRDTRLVFMLGHHGSPYLQPALTLEASKHGDIVVEDFVDSYHNLTLKTLFMLKWAAARCPSAPYVMKTDDDMLVNVRRVLREVEARGAPGSPFVFGHLGVGEPQRSRRSKWYLPPWLYPADVLPKFLTGAGYVMSRPAARQLLDRAMEVPLINLEDVYVTGLLAGRDPSIPLLTAAGARVERPLFAEHPCLLHHGYVVHGFGPAELAAAWRRLRALDAQDCKAVWMRCLAGLLRVADFRVVTDAGWGP